MEESEMDIREEENRDATGSKGNEKKLQKSLPQKVTGWLAIAICLLLLPILIANLAIIVKGSLNPDEIPTVLGYAPMAVVTNSMNTGEADAIRAGDLVITKQTDPDTLEVGDVIMFKNNQTAIIHRIVGYNDASDTFVTKGDANNLEDLDPVEKGKIIGKFTQRVPKVGDFILFSRTPLGMLICIGIPIILFLGYDFVAKRLTRRKEVRS
ncbi:signal peptidase I [Enterococcus sp. AZ072]|uniref:signal peptidase I n=1 Tax=unclassified Enterococcus TaxID=2608891 RepID=UPI003D29C136